MSLPAAAFMFKTERWLGPRTSPNGIEKLLAVAEIEAMKVLVIFASEQLLKESNVLLRDNRGIDIQLWWFASKCALPRPQC